MTPESVSFLNTISDFIKSSTTTNWLMVIITMIYVKATITIMRANKTSADIAKQQLEDSYKQLEESKRQNEEARRLEFMPFLQLQQCNSSISLNVKYLFSLTSDGPWGSKNYYTYRLINIGNGTATKIRFQCTSDSPGSHHISSTPLDSIMKGDGYYLRFTTAAPKESEVILSGTLTFTYSDLIGHNYLQEFQFISSNENHIISFTNGEPVLQ